MADVAIVGLGMAGATTARTLREAGLPVAIFEKSRGVGGRLATRRHAAEGEASRQFDHGAPWVAAHGDRFAAFLTEAVALGIAGRMADGRRTVGVPRQPELVRHALGPGAFGRRASEASFGFEVARLDRGDDGWRLHDGADRCEGPFRAVIVTTPAPQAVRLVGTSPSLLPAARGARYEPCWTLMLSVAPRFAERLAGRTEGLGIDGVASVIVEGQKPARAGANLVVHADARWSAEHLEWEREAVLDHFVPKLVAALGIDPPVVAIAHRWRYARVSKPAKLEAAFDATTMLGVAGDWLAGPDAEDAFTSALFTAQQAIDALG